jgi:Spy/CpxP family protein refolding chaperone
MGPGGVVGLPIERLGLADAQKAQVRTIVQSHETELAGLRDREFAAREALQSIIMADTVNEGAIRAKSADVALVEADMAVVSARIRAEVFAQLTPEQQARAREMPAPPAGRMPPPPPR